MNATTMSEHEKATLATEMFNHFCTATTMRQILGVYRNMCDTIMIRPGPLNEFYPKLKAMVRSWKAQALWKKFDARAAQKVYSKGTAASGTRVLIVGAGPCGLRTAIEAQLLGAKVVSVFTLSTAYSRRFDGLLTLLLSLCLSGRLWWRSGTDSAATTCSTCGHFSSPISRRSGRKSSTASSVPARSITSRSGSSSASC